MSNKRIARELENFLEARAAGEPYACGLNIACTDDNIHRWMCTYTCPQHYVFRGEQRVVALCRLRHSFFDHISNGLSLQAFQAVVPVQSTFFTLSCFAATTTLL